MTKLMNCNIISFIVHTFVIYTRTQACGLLSTYTWARMPRTASRLYHNVRSYLMSLIRSKTQLLEHTWHIALKGLSIGITLLGLSCKQVL